MADVTGPISSLPWSHHDIPRGTMCDEHPDRPAVSRIQGETDSFGSEMHDCCAECVEEIKKERVAALEEAGQCDWCKKEATGLRPTRDYDEGMSGPVYQVCAPCRKKADDAAREELDAMDDRPYDDEY